MLVSESSCVQWLKSEEMHETMCLQDSTKEWSASVQETNQRRKQEKQELEDRNTEQYRRKLSADELASWDARLEDVRQKAKDTEDA